MGHPAKSADPDSKSRPMLAITFQWSTGWYSGASTHRNEEDDLRKCMRLAIGGLVLLAGCGKQEEKANVPVTPKWQGAAYHIAFDTQAGKPNPAGVTIPDIKYTANPDALEKRATLVVKFDTSG